MGITGTAGSRTRVAVQSRGPGKRESGRVVVNAIFYLNCSLYILPKLLETSRFDKGCNN